MKGIPMYVCLNRLAGMLSLCDCTLVGRCLWLGGGCIKLSVKMFPLCALLMLLALSSAGWVGTYMYVEDKASKFSFDNDVVILL